MIPKIFDIENNVLIINENILSIPELKAVYDNYEDKDTMMNAFHFIRHMCDPYGAYNNMSEEEREETLTYDFVGDYSPEDDVIIAAIAKLKKLYMSPQYQFYLDSKQLLYTTGEWARTASVRDTDKNGNLSQILGHLKSVGKTITEFSILEKQAEKELQKMKMRGNRAVAYDEMEEDED